MSKHSIVSPFDKESVSCMFALYQILLNNVTPCTQDTLYIKSMCPKVLLFLNIPPILN